MGNLKYFYSDYKRVIFIQCILYIYQLIDDLMWATVSFPLIDEIGL